MITCVKIVAEEVFLIAIYDKSEFDSLPNKVLEKRLTNVDL